MTPIRRNAGAGSSGSWLPSTGLGSGGYTELDWHDIFGSSADSINTAQLTSGGFEVPPAIVLRDIVYTGTNFTITETGLTPSAYYLVTLYFSEGGSGTRTANWKINGVTVLTAFDIAAEAGGSQIAIARQFTAQADGSGNIAIRGDVVNTYAMLSAYMIEDAPAPPDTTDPTISIDEPDEGDNLAGTIDIDVTCSDDNTVVKLELYIDGELVDTFEDDDITSHTFSYDTTELDNDSHEIEVIAYDQDDNDESDSITLNVQNPPVAGFSIPGTGLVGVPVAITDTSVRAASYAYDKENNGSTDSTDDEPSFTYDTPGTFIVKQTVTNAYGSANVTHAIVISVSDSTPEITTSNLPIAPIGREYSQKINVVGGNEPIVLNVTEGELPEGLEIDGDEIVGTPTGPEGISTFSIEAEDADSDTDSVELSIEVLDIDVIAFCHKRPLEIEPIFTISLFENLDGSEDVIEDLAMKRSFNITSLYLDETERLVIYNFLLAHRLRQPFLWINPDRGDEALIVKLIKFNNERQITSYGEFAFVLKEV